MLRVGLASVSSEDVQQVETAYGQCQAKQNKLAAHSAYARRRD